ncbi:tetratricopeptide repeat protein [candidate division KSB1 bacterium]|nr:tetratricopeptide repeat protein [candidate division KSB1 bacterium]
MKKIIKYILINVLILTAVSNSQIKLPKAARKSDQRYRVALQYENNGRYMEALQIFKQLWAANPTNMSYYRGVKNNLLNTKQYTAAIEAAEKMLEIRNSYYIAADIGEIYYKLDQQEKAFSIWNKIINENKKNPAAYQAVANSMLSNRLFDEAIQIYQQGRKNIPTNTIFLIELANLYSSRIDYQNATEMYLEYLERMPNQYSYVESQLIRLAKNIEEVEPIANIIKERIKNGKNIYIQKKLLAQLYVNDSNYAAALKEYEDIDDLMSNMALEDQSEWGKELFDFAGNALRDGAYRFSEQAFRMVIAEHQNSPYISRSFYGLAESSYLQKKYSEALEAFQQITINFPKSTEAQNSWIRIGQIYLDHLNEPGTAKEAFEKVIQNFSVSDQHFDASFYIAKCDIRAGNLAAVQRRYENMLKMKNTSDLVIEKTKYRLALLKFWQGKFDESLSYLDEIIDVKTIIFNHNKGFFVNDALELSMLIRENLADKKILESYATSRLLVEQNIYDEAIKKLTELEKEKPPAGLIEHILLMKGELFTETGNYEQAIDVYRKIVKQYPDGLKRDIAQKRIGDVYLQQLKDKQKAIEEYELVLTKYPKSLLLEDVRKIIRKLESR